MPKSLTQRIAQIFGRRLRSVTPQAALARVANRPMEMAPGALEAMIASALASAPREFMDDGDWAPHGSKPEHLIQKVGPIGVLSIHGPLFQRFDLMAWWFGGAGYDVIGAAFDTLLADDEVKSIVIDFDSPGGEVAGSADLSDQIHAARGTKPIRAVANDSCYSAAYKIASAADDVTVTRTGGVGSIGTIATHLDVTGYDAQMGLRYTLIHAGARKADGNPHIPLSEEARDEIQDEVNRLREIFIDTVARNRDMGDGEVRDTEAAPFYGPAGVDAGLADQVGTLAGVIAQQKALAPADAGAVGTGTAPPAVAPAVAAVVQSRPALGESVEAAVAQANERIAALTAEGEAARAELQRLNDGLADEIAAHAQVTACTDLPDSLKVALTHVSAQKLTTANVAAAIERAHAIRDLCTAAGLPDMAADYVRQNTQLEAVRTQLIAAKADSGPEIVTTLPAMDAEKSKAAQSRRLDPTAIYQARH